MKNIHILFSFLLFLFFTGQILHLEPLYPGQLHAEQREYKFAVTDIVGLEELQREFEAFQKILSESTGLSIKLFPVTNRTVVVEAFRSKRLDFALTGPAEYVVLSSKTKAQPIVGLTRPGYFSILVAKTNSTIKNVADLKGKKVAFGDYGSTSYHLAPLQLIADGGLDPKKDIEAINLSKLVAWKSFVRDKVDAIGLNQSRFELFKGKENLPDTAYRVIAQGPELPNDLIVAAEHVPVGAITAIQNAFSQNSEKLMQAILQGERNQKYKEMAFFTGIKDSDYNYVREMYRTAGYAEFASEQSSG